MNKKQILENYIEVYCFIGGAGSGKDSLFNKIKTLPFLYPVISVATRKPRIGEIEGVSYFFKQYQTVLDMKEKGELIEERFYTDANGDPQIYGMPKSSIDLYSNKKYIVIVDFGGYEQLKKYIGSKGHVYSIFIDCSAQERLKRSISREEGGFKLTDKQINEICFRQLDDDKTVISRKNKCDLIVTNETKEDFKKAIEQIIEFIKK